MKLDEILLFYAVHKVFKVVLLDLILGTVYVPFIYVTHVTTYLHINIHCVKGVRIRSNSGPYSFRKRENTDQNNSEYEHFLRSDTDSVSKHAGERKSVCFYISIFPTSTE